MMPKVQVSIQWIDNINDQKMTYPKFNLGLKIDKSITTKTHMLYLIK
jgi:hypothetical protein